jgi:glutamate synthase (NADPH/NADH) small chain
VREAAEGKPVQIGRLQRYATDTAMARDRQFYARAAPTGKTAAVVGAGPAGLACAHRLAMHGHDVTIFEAREKAGGLNEYGIAAYKAVDGFAQAEVDYVMAIGGITIEKDKALGRDFTLADLTGKYDAVFLGAGLAGVNALRVEGEDAEGAADAVDFIETIRQADDLAMLPVGRRVVVIGGGMTAIDAAVQSKLLGAEEVTICYRRGRERMSASEYEQDLAAANGVTIRHWLQPKRVIAEGGKVAAIELEYTALKKGGLAGTGEMLRLEADQIFKAIGQNFDAAPLNNGNDRGSGNEIMMENGKIRVDAEGRTSIAMVWAGGDCVAGGEDLTVTAVAQGRDAAESIHRTLVG